MYLRRLRRLAEPYLLTERLLLRSLTACSEYVAGNSVDLGSGDFRLSRRFLPQVSELVGIDNWLAARVHTRKPEQARFYYGTVEALPFRDCAFDTVFCTEVVEHVEDPPRLMYECARVMKSGAHAVMSAPFNFFVHGAPNDFRRYTIYGLAQLLRGAGLDLVAYTHVAGGFLTFLNHVLMTCGFQRRLGRRLLGRSAVVTCNLIGLAALAIAGAARLTDKTDPALNDRTQPLGYALVARKPNDGAAPAEDTSVVCPVCHGELMFGDREIRCGRCEATYPYFEGVPVLASPEQLHLVLEATGRRVELST